MRVIIAVAVAMGAVLIGFVVYTLMNAETVGPTESGTTEPTYSLEDVARHSSKNDCWTAIDGNVYDLTRFIGNHPGGERILEICGKEGSEAFKNQGVPAEEATQVRSELSIPEDQPFHSPNAQSILDGLKIGVLET